MADTPLERPTFFEGQYLGADDLAALVDYVRAQSARHNLGQHSWGIVMGLDLATQAVSDTEVDVYVQPGVAVDGYGRVIVVGEPVRLEAEPLLGIGSGEVPVWIRFEETQRAGVRKGFEVCDSDDNYARAGETFVLEAGERDRVLDRQGGILVAGLTLVDAREALNAVNPDAPLVCDAAIPHQVLPVEADSHWLVPLGLVLWGAANAGFQAPSDAMRVRSRARRRYVGSVTEQVLAADGLLRLGGRFTEPDPAQESDTLCAQSAPQSSDFLVCDGQLSAREPIWLMAHTRVGGDLRLFDGCLELRDQAGRDYVDRIVDGVAIAPISPLALKRADGNAQGGSDLQVLLGPSEDGRNRLAIGAASVPDVDLCDFSLASDPASPKVLVQDNGRVGIGTSNPDTDLVVPLTIRGLARELVENEGTPEEDRFDVYGLLAAEDDTGALRWQLDLWRDQASLSFDESGVANARLYLRAGGNVGIGTAEPEARLDIHTASTTEPWFRAGIGGDSGRVWIEYGSQLAPLLVLSDMDDPPRIQFQQTGSTDPADDTSPVHSSWIGQAHNDSSDLAVMGGRLGIGTEVPDAQLAIQGDGGGLRLYSGQNGGHFWIGYYNDGGPGTARAGWIGYGSDGSIDLTIRNERPGGDIVLDPERNVGIDTSSPNAKLDVRGEIRFGAAGDLLPVAGPGLTALRAVTGRVSSDGGVEQGSGFIVDPRIPGGGSYTLRFNPSFLQPPVVVVSPFGHTDNVVSVSGVTNQTCVVRTYDVLGTNAGNQDIAFTFIALGAR